MKYLDYQEKDGNVTRISRVSVDVERLKDIIKELNEKCSRYHPTTIIGLSKENAMEELHKSYGDDYTILRESGGSYPNNLYYIEIIAKKTPRLVGILNKILEQCEHPWDVDENSMIIDELRKYKDSIEIMPFDQAIQMLQKRLSEVSVCNNESPLYEDLEFYLSIATIEREYNKDFDFALLASLYEQAKDCFRIYAVSESINFYNDIPRKYQTGSVRKL